MQLTQGQTGLTLALVLSHWFGRIGLVRCTYACPRALSFKGELKRKEVA